MDPDGKTEQSLFDMQQWPSQWNKRLGEGGHFLGPSALDHYGAGHNVVNCPVVLEEEERDEDRKEKSDGEVLVQRSHSGAANVRNLFVFLKCNLNLSISNIEDIHFDVKKRNIKGWLLTPTEKH